MVQFGFSINFFSYDNLRNDQCNVVFISKCRRVTDYKFTDSNLILKKVATTNSKENNIKIFGDFKRNFLQNNITILSACSNVIFMLVCVLFIKLCLKYTIFKIDYIVNIYIVVISVYIYYQLCYTVI